MIAVSVVWTRLYILQSQRDTGRANGAGERIVSIIQRELGKCLNTTDIILDLYKVKGDEFLEDFEPLCEALLNHNIVIGSMYWAPDGVIRYAYPDIVDESTLDFEMLKDPIQGPKAVLAKQTGKATIAGPHNLLEGGKGLILRNPHFSADGQFEGFSIMVVDAEIFLQKVISHIEPADQKYRFSVWKDDDPTATTDSLGYIFSSNQPIAERKVIIPFVAPNDRWYLTLEPLDGWNTLNNMTQTTIICLASLVLILLMLYLAIHNQQIREEMAESNASNAAKTSFLFNMSHDIRTPMNAIMGFRDLLEKYQDIPERRAAYLDKIKDSSNVLLSIINNVLEMARIEKGAIVVENKVCDIIKESNMLASVYQELIRQKGLELRHQANVEHPYIYCDTTKVHQIFMNIVSNAIKYTPSGGYVEIILREKSYADGIAYYETIISDNGIGMSEEFLPHLFDEFTREHTASYQKVEGTGLGMAIVKKLVDNLGGTINVSSTKGKGTTFSVIIPHRTASKELLADTSGSDTGQQTLSGKRILLTEDNDLNAEIAMELLADKGFEVDRVSNGEECLETIQKSPADYYSLILMDIQMPIMNGYEATAAIRTISDKRKASIPILAMTANAFEEDRQEAIHCGMNGHLAKPINVQELMREIAKVVR